MLNELMRNPSRSLFGRSGRDPFGEFQNAISRVFDDFRFDSPAIAGFSEATSVFNPQLDIHETDNEVILTAEVPGLAEKDVQVELDRDMLTVRGEKREEKTAGDAGRHFCERRYGAFERRIRLPIEVDKERIMAKLDNGVLRVAMPKTAEAKTQVKKIPVKS